jgi:hypothetical protein
MSALLLSILWVFDLITISLKYARKLNCFKYNLIVHKLPAEVSELLPRIYVINYYFLNLIGLLDHKDK